MTQVPCVQYPYNMARPRSARFDLRCPPIVRLILEEAAEKAQETLTTFVLRASLARARTYIGGNRKEFDDAEKAMNPFFSHR